MLVISRKAYRFNNPTVNLVKALDEQYRKNTKFDPADAPYCEVQPGGRPGQAVAFGTPTRIPDWAKEDGMFKLAVKDGDLVVLPDKAATPDPPSPNPSQGDVAKVLAQANADSSGVDGDTPAEPPAEEDTIPNPTPRGKKNRAA
jgi:hypothetical protein